LPTRRTPRPWWAAFRHANTRNRSEFEALVDAMPATLRDGTAPAERAESPMAASPPAAVPAPRAPSGPARGRTTDRTTPLRADRGWITDDLLAGATVSLVAIPQSLAYAQLAGVPPYYGLYAALVPTVVGAVCGSSRQLSTGPVAMTSLLTAASVAPLAAAGSDVYCGYVVLLALLSGVFQVVFGVMRVGVLLNFLSHPVLVGFVNAAALIIGMSQLPTLLGIAAPQSDRFLLDVWRVLGNIDAMHGLSLGFGIAAFTMLVLLKRAAPSLPGVLITVGLLTWLSATLDYAGMGGQVVGTIPAGLPDFGLPAFDHESLVRLVPSAFVIAVISFMEAMSSAKIISIRTRHPWNENRELIGQGLAKIAAALSQTMPVSGSFSRSALNLASNARTQLSSLVSAACVLVTLLFFTGLLHHLPKPVLAAVIMMAVVGLINFQAFGKAWRASRDDGIAAVATFGATLAFAPHIENGIVSGILLSLALLLYRLMRPRVKVLAVTADGALHEGPGRAPAQAHPHIGAVRFDGDLRFVNVSWFENALLGVERSRPEVTSILVKANGIHHLDASGVEMIGNLVQRFRANGITLAFSGVRPPVREVMDATGLTGIVGPHNLHATDADALLALHACAASAPSALPGSDAEGATPDAASTPHRRP